MNLLHTIITITIIILAARIKTYCLEWIDAWTDEMVKNEEEEERKKKQNEKSPFLLLSVPFHFPIASLIAV